MANITSTDTRIISSLLIINGKILNFSEKKFYIFFKKISKLDLKKPKYRTNQNSVVDRFLGFFSKEDDYTVYITLEKLLSYYSKTLLKGKIDDQAIDLKIKKVNRLIKRIRTRNEMITNSLPQYVVHNNVYNIHREIYKKIIDNLYEEQYSDALTKALKVVENKVKKLHNKSNLYKLTNIKNLEKLLIKIPEEKSVEKSFVAGMQHLFCTVLKFRDYNTHSESEKIDKNLSIHLIFMSSLACYLLDKELVKKV